MPISPAVYVGGALALGLGALLWSNNSSASTKTTTTGNSNPPLPPKGQPAPGYASDPDHQFRWQIDNTPGDETMSKLALTITGKSELYPDLLEANQNNPHVKTTTQWYHPPSTSPDRPNDVGPSGGWKFQDSNPGPEWQNRGKVIVPWNVGTGILLPKSWNVYIDQTGKFTGTGKQYPPDPRGPGAYVMPAQDDAGDQHLPMVGGARTNVKTFKQALNRLPSQLRQVVPPTGLTRAAMKARYGIKK